jgi:hypothetical protein
MKGDNAGVAYEVRLTSTVKKHSDGHFFEEYAWSELTARGQPRPLPETSRNFRMAVTLEPGRAPFAPPDISKAPNLSGPVLDLVTFYADLYLAMHAGALRNPGDRFKVPSPGPASWADGRRILTGQDAVDFEVALTAIDEPGTTATLLVKHVPPEKESLRFPAESQSFGRSLPVLDASSAVLRRSLESPEGIKAPACKGS